MWSICSYDVLAVMSKGIDELQLKQLLALFVGTEEKKA